MNTGEVVLEGQGITESAQFAYPNSYIAKC
jgi:hypothetical protein